MSRHAVTVEWDRAEAAFTDHRYSRRHRLRFDGGLEVPGSSSPHVVRVPYSDPAAVDPEEGFVAALSSCHMLWFLDLAARAGYVVDAYVDEAAGFLARRDDGKSWLSRVELSPRVRFGPGKEPSDADVQRLHHEAHEECFLANAYKGELVVRSGWTVSG
jgi:organic hydroperoxide reductase OsmC/OhrA